MERAKAHPSAQQVQQENGGSALALGNEGADSLPRIVTETQTPGKLSVPVFDRRQFLRRAGNAAKIGAALTPLGGMLAACAPPGLKECKPAQHTQLYNVGTDSEQIVVGGRTVQFTTDVTGDPNITMEWMNLRPTVPNFDGEGAWRLAPGEMKTRDLYPGQVYTWEVGDASFFVAPERRENGQYEITYGNGCGPEQTPAPEQPKE